MQYDSGVIQEAWQTCRLSGSQKLPQLWRACRGLVNFGGFVDKSGINDVSDFELVAMVALDRAVRCYDQSRSVQFATYARRAMTNAVLGELKRCARPAHFEAHSDRVGFEEEFLEAFESSSMWDTDWLVQRMVEQIKEALEKHKRSVILVPIFDARCEGMNSAEIAKLTGMGVDTVRHYLRVLKSFSKQVIGILKRRPEYALCFKDV